ncbi:hypothetical protein [Pseudomonas sp. 22 E 5]|nr:hypothetical protein [Pseudomonas sp. 22 E 5]
MVGGHTGVTLGLLKLAIGADRQYLAQIKLQPLAGHRLGSMIPARIFHQNNPAVLLVSARTYFFVRPISGVGFVNESWADGG